MSPAKKNWGGWRKDAEYGNKHYRDRKMDRRSQYTTQKGKANREEKVSGEKQKQKGN